MKVIIFITVFVIIAVSLVIYFIKKHKAKVASQRETYYISPEEREQDIKNCSVISKIIQGHHTPVSSHDHKKFVGFFEQWLLRQKYLFRDATPQMIKELNNRRKDIDVYSYSCEISDIDPRIQNGGKLPRGYEVILENAFTEPFPSFHDMDDWAITTQLTDIFILMNISNTEARSYAFYLKKHFTNHKMRHAIIMFDLYKISHGTQTPVIPIEQPVQAKVEKI